MKTIIIIHIFLLIHSCFNQLNSNDRQYLLNQYTEHSVIVIRKVLHLGNLTCVLRTRLKEVLDVLFSYSHIKENDVMSAYENGYQLDDFS